MSMEITKREGGVLYKRPKNEQEVEFLLRHHDCLLQLEGLDVAPKSLLKPDVIYGVGDLWPEEDLGTNQPITTENEVEFVRGCVRLLDELHDKGIHHADLTRHNIVVKNNRPYAVDFHESLFFNEWDSVPKRPEGDAYWMWHGASELSPDSTRRIRRWRAIRPYLVPSTSFVDFGTAMGDFLAMADAEHIGLRVLGYDNMSQEDWTNRLQHPHIVQADINHLTSYECHTALFLSVYPHIARAEGYDVAFATLCKIINGSQQAFVEFQLNGDGIGDVTGFKDDDEVLDLLARACHGTQKYIDPIVTVPVYGREPCVRTVWRVYED